MGQSAEELRRDIERTREDLGGTLDAIGDRVSPSRVVERRRNRMRDSVTSVRERVMGSAHDTYSSAAGRVSDTGGGISDRAHGVTDAVRSAPEEARHQAQGNPMLAGALAFGAGLLAAMAFPGTRTEGQVARSAMDAAQPLKEEVGRMGQEMKSSLQESGMQAAEQVKQTASQAAEEVKATAQDETQRAKEVGTAATQEVRDQASTAASDVKGPGGSQGGPSGF